MKHWVKLGGEQSTWRMRQEEAMLVWQGGEPAHDCAATPGPPTACSSLLLLLPLQCILHKSSHCLLLATHYCTVHSAQCTLQCTVHRSSHCSPSHSSLLVQCYCTGPPPLNHPDFLAPPTDPQKCSSVHCAIAHCTGPLNVHCPLYLCPLFIAQLLFLNIIKNY